MKRQIRGLIPLLAVTALAVACSDDPTRPSILDELLRGTGGALDDRLDAARARWEAQGFSDYHYRITYGCFCGFAQPVLVSVKSGEVVSAVFVDTGEPVPEGIEVHFPTIDGLFDFLESSLARQPEEASLEFDPGLGVPTRASFDFSRMVADDEISFVLTFLFTG